MDNFNEEEVRLCYKFLRHLNETEIRIIDPKKEKSPQSFFIRSEDEFVEKCKEHNGKYNIYAGINERECKGTKKENVISVKTIVIDIDAVREDGHEHDPATDKELEDAEAICNKIINSIGKSNGIIPLKIHSGNGYQLWFALPTIYLDDINRNDIETKLQLFQDKIINTFNMNGAIDKIGDMPRIIKVWGTYNIKGIESDGRPYRVAKLLNEFKIKEDSELKKAILELKIESYKGVEFDYNSIDDIDIEGLPPCISHLLKFYENKNGDYWFRIIQLFSSFFFSIGLKENIALIKILQWNKKQVYHENGEENEIKEIVSRVYRNMINMANCKKIKYSSDGFPYFGVASLKLCKPDNKCKNCINPVIRYKRGNERDEIPHDNKQISIYRQLAEDFISKVPVYYDERHLWYMWNREQYCWELIDETKLMIKFDRYFIKPTDESQFKNSLMEALRKTARQNEPTLPKKTWVQFKDKIVDIETDECFDASEKYFIFNPLPYSMGNNKETPIIDSIFGQWVGENNIKILKEIMAYSCLSYMPIHRIFCFIGSGRNGKGTFIKVLKKFIGNKNIGSTDLPRILSGRFETAKFYKKLVVVIGEIDKTIFRQTAVLKSLSGEDILPIEYKGKMPFDFVNYAKPFILTNALPETSDKTIGFYSRWCIVDFPNRFNEGTDVLSLISDEEYENFCSQVPELIKGIIKNGGFSGEGNIMAREIKYEQHSSPLKRFIELAYIKDVDGKVSFEDFFIDFNDFCQAEGFRRQSKIEIGLTLKKMGFEKKITSDYTNFDYHTTKLYVLGLKKDEN